MAKSIIELKRPYFINKPIGGNNTTSLYIPDIFTNHSYGILIFFSFSNGNTNYGYGRILIADGNNLITMENVRVAGNSECPNLTFSFDSTTRILSIINSKPWGTAIRFLIS